MTMSAKILVKNTIFLNWIWFEYDKPGYDITTPLLTKLLPFDLFMLSQVPSHYAYILWVPAQLWGPLNK